MSKFLKVVSVVAAIAAAIPTGGASLLALGISASAFTAIAVGAAIGATLLAKKPKAPEIPREAIDRMRASIQ